MIETLLLINSGEEDDPTIGEGQLVFVTPGTYNLVVPEGVYRLSGVAVGAGGGTWDRTTGAVGAYGASGAGGSLRYKIWFAVTPGETLTVVVGAPGTNSKTAQGEHGGNSYIARGGTILLQGNGGTSGGATGSAIISNTNGGGVGDGGGNGGNNFSFWQHCGGGAGAGGYSSVGGVAGGGTYTPGAGNGGGGSGGYGNPANTPTGLGGLGGGVGIFGEGPSGASPGQVNHANGNPGSQYPGSGAYGGGAPMPSKTLAPRAAQGGAVRVVWGAGRRYPNYVPNV